MLRILITLVAALILGWAVIAYALSEKTLKNGFLQPCDIIELWIVNTQAVTTKEKSSATHNTKTQNLDMLGDIVKNTGERTSEIDYEKRVTDTLTKMGISTSLKMESKATNTELSWKEKLVESLERASQSTILTVSDMITEKKISNCGLVQYDMGKEQSTSNVEIVANRTSEKAWDELTDKQKIAKNPNNCDLNKQVMWNDGSCHDKAIPSVSKTTATTTASWLEQCHEWAQMAGILLNDAAIKLIERESKCSPTVCNPNGIACGIPQALPWTKMGCALEHTDEAAMCQIRWFKQYVVNRYGSYEAALNHSYTNGWY